MKTGSDPVMCGELIAAAPAELLVEVVSARFKLVAVEAVSVGFVSLEEVEGAEMRASDWTVAGEEAESMWSVDGGLRVSSAVGGRGAGVTGDVEVTGTPCVSAVVTAPELGG